MLIVLAAASPTLGWPSIFAPPAPQTPHPAVVRVSAVDKRVGNTEMRSEGSGVLVAVNDTHGMVVTNFHVIRDATGAITVAFPDGFRSRAVVLQVDRVWDLAALAIQRPNVRPVPLAAQPPRPGEVLTIAGYGPGPYRAAAGRCSGYVSPQTNYPREWVEVSVAARQGDSGGPILNERGEVAGVLFGTGFGETLGSYCGRVRYFLTAATPAFEGLSPPVYMASQPPATRWETAPQSVPQSAPAAPIVATPSPPIANNTMRPLTEQPFAAAPRGGTCAGGVCRVDAPPASRPVVSATAATPPPPPPVVSMAPPVSHAGPAEVPPASMAELIKTVLAAIGGILLLFHAVRLVGAAVG